MLLMSEVHTKVLRMFQNMFSHNHLVYLKKKIRKEAVKHLRFNFKCKTNVSYVYTYARVITVPSMNRKFIFWFELLLNRRIKRRISPCFFENGRWKYSNRHLVKQSRVASVWLFKPSNTIHFFKVVKTDNSRPFDSN